MSREECMLWSDLGFSLLRLHTLLQREEKELAARYQLGAPHVEVLYLLSRLQCGEGEWMLASRLYPYLPITQPAIGRILKHLRYWRFVELQRDKGDRRRLLVRLLPAAQKLLSEIEFMRARTLRQFFPSLSPSQLRIWVEALRNRTFAAAEAYHVEPPVGLHSQ
ncbi:MAG: MarR family winged helix-turn-helix transcriptional regulator [Bacteroidia bacterium]|nr:MarR family winged helix-turn-helix transcriptional regulator [Bacteroidia bacterium]MDW8016122.1 MarR family winged helix-turn-helix transcriptional regulator [Bacteroidia bacterium]